jgi:hypothetical protein
VTIVQDEDIKLLRRIVAGGAGELDSRQLEMKEAAN